MTREEILEDARQAVTQDRAGTYGSPEDNFAVIGRLSGDYGASISGPGTRRISW